MARDAPIAHAICVDTKCITRSASLPDTSSSHSTPAPEDSEAFDLESMHSEPPTTLTPDAPIPAWPTPSPEIPCSL